MIGWLRNRRAKAKAQQAEFDRRNEHIQAVRKELLAHPDAAGLDRACHLAEETMDDLDGLRPGRGSELSRSAYFLKVDVEKLRTANKYGTKLTPYERMVLSALDPRGRPVEIEELIGTLLAPQDDRWQVRDRVSRSLLELERMVLVERHVSEAWSEAWRVTPGGAWVLQQLGSRKARHS